MKRRADEIFTGGTGTHVDVPLPNLTPHTDGVLPEGLDPQHLQRLMRSVRAGIDWNSLEKDPVFGLVNDFCAQLNLDRQDVYMESSAELAFSIYSVVNDKPWAVPDASADVDVDETEDAYAATYDANAAAADDTKKQVSVYNVGGGRVGTEGKFKAMWSAFVRGVGGDRRLAARGPEGAQWRNVKWTHYRAVLSPLFVGSVDQAWAWMVRQRAKLSAGPMPDIEDVMSMRDDLYRCLLLKSVSLALQTEQYTSSRGLYSRDHSRSVRIRQITHTEECLMLLRSNT